MSLTRNRMMRQQRARGTGRAQEVSIPLPVKGVLAEAMNAEVSSQYAAELENWQSDGLKLTTRAPYSRVFSRGCSLSADWRIPFEFGLTDGYIETSKSGTTWGQKQAPRNIKTPCDSTSLSGHVLIVDGNGAPLLFNGEEFSLATTDTPEDDGQSVEAFDGVIAHHDRTYFWKRGGPLEFYYGDVGEITENTITKFPLDRLGNITGGLQEMVSLTMDAGHGMNDVLCIITTTGEMVLYEGFDPGDAQDWRLTSRIKSSAPISPEGFVSIGGDTWMLTPSGVVSIMQSVRSGLMALVDGIGRPIMQRLLERVSLGGDWQMFASRDAGMIILNHVLNGESEQFIYYTQSKAWTTARYPAARWHSLGLDTQFTGLDGRLYQIDRHTKAEGSITARWRSGWFSVNKYSAIRYLKPTILATGPVTIKATILSDFDSTPSELVEAQQTVTMQADRGDGAVLNFDEIIAADAAGSVYQILLEVTAPWAQMVNLKAGVV